MHEVRYGVINLLCCRHITISDEILAVVQNVRSIAFSAVITRLYLQTYNATLIIKNICEFVLYYLSYFSCGGTVLTVCLFLAR